jgi:cytochrome b561
VSAPLQAVAIESSTSRSGGSSWGVRPRFIVDLVLTVSFVSLMSVPFTGLPLHEWWGIGLIAVIVLHLLAQWDWTIASTRRFLGALTGRLRFTYVLNWLLFIAMVLVMVSGILISEAALPSVGLPTARSTGNVLFRFWRLLHTVSADAVIVLAGIHLGLNWRWVLNAIRQIVLSIRRRSRQPAAAESRP